MINIHDLTEAIGIVDITDAEASQVTGGGGLSSRERDLYKNEMKDKYTKYFGDPSNDEFLRNRFNQIWSTTPGSLAENERLSIEVKMVGDAISSYVRKS